MKKIISILLICFILVGCEQNIISPSQLPREETTQPTEKTAEPFPQEVIDMINEQEKPSAAWNELYELFQNAGSSNTIYPKGYAGGWIKGDKLHIALSSDDDKTVNLYKEHLKDFLDNIVFETVEYSLNELEQIRDIVTEAVEKTFCINTHYVDFKENKIVMDFLDFDDEMKKNIEAFLVDFIEQNEELSEKGVTVDLFVLEKGEIIILR